MGNKKLLTWLLWAGFEVHGLGQLGDYRFKLLGMKVKVLISSAKLNSCL